MVEKPTYEELEQRIRDLERGKSAEKGLCSPEEDQESMYRLILESISDTVIVTDDQGNMLYVCPNTTFIFGLSQDQVYNQQTIQRLMNGTVCDISELKDQHKIKGIEWSITNSYGKTRCLLINAKSVSINGGTVLYVMHDITERKQAEEELRKHRDHLEELVKDRTAALRESEEKYREVVETSVDGVISVDSQMKVGVWNKGAERIFGCTEEEMTGQSLMKIVPERYKKEKEKGFVEFRKSGLGPVIGKTLELQGVRKDGTEIRVELSVSSRKNNETHITTAIVRDITERKRAEESLKLFRSLMEQSNDAVEVVDPETGRFLDLNEKAFAELGYTREEFLSLKVTDIDPIVDKSQFPKVVAALRKSGSMMLESLHHRKDGTTFPVEVSLRYVQLDREYVVAIVRDITEHKRTDGALRESEEKYRSMMEAMVDAVYICSSDFKVEYMNPAMIKSTGRDAVGEPCFKALNNLDQQCPWCVYDQVQKGETIEIEILSPLDNRSYNVSNAPIFHGDGSISKMTIYRDITDKKQAEKEQILLSTVIEQVLESIIISDGRGTIQYINPSFEQLSGFVREDITGQNFRILKSDKHDEAFYREMYDIISSGKIWQGHITNIMKDGTLREFETTISPVRDSSGKIINYVSVNRDITQEVALEAQLRQAQKMEAIGTLAGGISHDFNNLLTAILGYAELSLMDLGKDNPVREKIEEIKKAGNSAASLTRQLLAFSRKQIVQPKVIDLNELLSGMEKMLGRLLSEDVELLTIPKPELWPVEIDPGQMEQVIMNLAINSGDAMSGGGKLTFETANVDLGKNYFREHGIEEQPGSYVMLAVSDTGIGMDKETQEHIFEPFFTTKEIDKGTGLSLSTVYGIVKQNNGFIWVYSEPGQGTTFKVYFPKVKGDVEAVEKERTPVVKLDGSETVLIVEDDDSLRKLTRTVLKQKGYKVLEAENGEEALKVSEAHDGSIDLMITDVVMPKMGGKETAERLQPLYPQMKVIYMSGYTDNAIVHHGVLAPGLNFLEKPFTPKALARKVREVLDK